MDPFATVIPGFIVLVLIIISVVFYIKWQGKHKASNYSKNLTTTPIIDNTNKNNEYFNPPKAKKTNINPPIIFLSYRRSDSNSIAGRIYDRLVQHLPRECIFKDVDSIPFGIDFREHLSKMIRTCNLVFVIIGPSWVNVIDKSGKRRLADPADFVRIEIEEALRRGIRVIPLLIDGAEMPKENDLPDSLKPLAFRNGIAIRHDPDFHNDMSRLLRDIELGN